jgi:hypothetical protein
MQVFQVDIEQRRVSRRRVVAADAATAQSAAQMLLRPGDRVVDISTQALVTATEAQDALDHLLQAPFLPRAGEPMALRDWLIMVPYTAVEDLNSHLALAGLRVAPDRRVISIGSPSSIPVLHEWFRKTPWAGTRLMHVLGVLPDAQRVNLTYAGIRSRSIALPFETVLQGEAA